jgi:hypothetical protein
LIFLTKWCIIFENIGLEMTVVFVGYARVSTIEQEASLEAQSDLAPVV